MTRPRPAPDTPDQAARKRDSAVPAVIYAAKSTEDTRGSIPTQLAGCRAACEAAGRLVIGEECDEAKSGYKGNRGDGLTRAKEAAVRAAEEHGEAELWVQHSDRLTRGDGLSADHLAEIFFAMRRASVRLRSVQDDSNLEDVIRVALVGERNHEDSARKSAATRDGKRRAAERGDWVGGICPDGLRVLRDVDERGKTTARLDRDPDRAPIFDLIWRCAVEGWSDRAIVLELDRHGHRTAPKRSNSRPRPFDANRIRQTLTNPLYAGLSVYRGEVVGVGQWPAFVSVEDFERLRAQRRGRARQASAKQPPGRPPEGYVLARVAVCACGSPMDVVTVRYVRQDGTRKRTYVCRSHRERPQDCGAQPIDAAIVDRAFVSNLTTFLGDVDGWRDRLVQTREGERARLSNECSRARAALAKVEHAVERIGAKYAEHVEHGEDADADAVRGVLKAKREERERAERLLEAAVSALEGVGEAEEPLDPLLDFYGGLQAEIAGRVDGAGGDVRRLNAAVREFFAEVRLTATEGGIEVLPLLSVAAVERIVERPELWPHKITAAIAGRPARLVSRGALIAERFEALLMRDPAAAGELLDQMRAARPDGSSARRDPRELLLEADFSEAEIEALIAEPGDAELIIDVSGPPRLTAGVGDGIVPPLRTISVPGGNPQARS